MKLRQPELKKSAGATETPETRAARIARVVEEGKAAGDVIPSGIHLIGTREPTAAEIAFGMSLGPINLADFEPAPTSGK